MTERETETRALAGPLVNARATSAGVAPWAPIPGRRSTARGISLRASATARGYVAPTTAPTLERPRLPTRPAPQSFTSWAVWCQSGRPSDMVTSWRSEERRVGKECRSRCDWSSDVCSSDLDARKTSVAHEARSPVVHELGRVVPKRTAVRHGDVLEVGRASCRERV